METTKRLHPLLTAAAASLIVFSGVGIAALTGVLPLSRGSSAPEAQPPSEQDFSMPAPAGTTSSAPVAKPQAKPRHVARAVAPRPPAPAPVAQVGAGGVIESVKEIEQKAENPIAGPIIGGIAGAVLGHQVGSGRTRTVATAVGAGAGILGGKVIEEKVRASKHWETTVRLDDGSTKTISSETQPAWQQGERVRVVDGAILKS